MKKGIIWVVGILAVLVFAGYIIVNNWADTGHGKLNTKVAVILKFMELTADDSIKDLEDLSVAESREQLMQTVKKFSDVPVQLPKIINQTIPGPAGEIPIRIYIPEESKVLPVTLFYHGGGWVQGNLDSHDNVVRYMAARSGSILVAVDYRLAPENPFPAAVEDAYAALKWVAGNAKLFSGDPSKIAVMGDSAGGNLSAVVSLMARDKNGPKISRQILVYPATNLKTLDTDSYMFFGEGFMLTRKEIEWFRAHYLPNKSDWSNPMASPLLAKDHSNLPPATIITAQMDPLSDEGKQYADKLEQSGVEVRYHRFEGMIHGFISAGKVLNQAYEAMDEIALDLKQSFGT